MFLRIIALGPKKVPPWGSIVLHMIIKGNVKNLQVSDSGPVWPSCFYLSRFMHAGCVVKLMTEYFETKIEQNFLFCDKTASSTTTPFK